MTLQNIPTPVESGFDSIFCEPSTTQNKRSPIANLAKSILIETACAGLLVTTACCFTASTATAFSIASFAVGTVAVNTLLRSVSTSWVPALNFAVLFGTTGNLLVHEAGHVAAASLVYKNLKAQITLLGLFRGAVSWTKTGLTPLGSLLGGVNSRLLVCVAGPLAAVLAGTAALVAGRHFKNHFPEFSRYLTAASAFTIAYQTLYALSALWASNADLGHDFIMLWHVGVNPVVASIFLVSIPLIVLSAYPRLRTKVGLL